MLGAEAKPELIKKTPDISLLSFRHYPQSAIRFLERLAEKEVGTRAGVKLKIGDVSKEKAEPSI